MSGEFATSALELEAQADELEAEALRLRARAKRIRAETESSRAPESTEPAPLTRAEYAKRSRISEATVSRLITEGMPCIPVGSTVRIDPAVADDWRRSRGRRPTKATSAKAGAAEEPDVSDCLERAGLRHRDLEAPRRPVQNA